MIPNSHPETEVRLQELVGNRHEDRFYLDFSGVARSFNFYPVSPMKASDGIAEVTPDLGKAMVEGEQFLPFSPRYPRHLVQLSSVDNTLRNYQREFWALELPGKAGSARKIKFELSRFGIETTDRDGVLSLLGSTYSHQNHAIYDGVSRPGSRLVTFTPILKEKQFPLADILSSLLGPTCFNPEHSTETAREVALYNRELASIDSLYVLIGMGQWGSSHPWLGIPVKWEDIWDTRVIVEDGLPYLEVALSQGTRFFQNITISRGGYFPVGSGTNQGKVDWDWLSQQPASRETKYVRHVRLENPVAVVMDGESQEGLILFPD